MYRGPDACCVLWCTRRRIGSDEVPCNCPCCFASARPVRIGQVGAGKFGTMFLSQVRLTTGMHLLGLADLSPERARERMLEVGWPKQQTEAKSMADALATGKTFLTDEAMGVISHPEVEVVIEATGDPATGIRPRAAIGWTGIS